MTDPQIPDLLARHGWPAVAAAVILLLARAAKEPAIGSPFARVPVRYRPHVVLVLGSLSGVLDAVVRGTPWVTALLLGLTSAAVAMAVHGAAGGVNPRPAAPTASGLPAPARVEVETAIAGLPDVDARPPPGAGL